MKNKKGFTLAEVLVTLAVIGVVAALTIPALIQSSNEKQAKTSVKKALSILNQALTMSIAQDGVDAGSTSSATGLKDIFNGYLSSMSSTTNSITTTDGMIYTFYGDDTNPCTNSATTSTCLVEVDINGTRGNSIVSNTSNYADLYYFLILQEQIIPANTAQAAAATLPDFGRHPASSTLSNVAVNALLE